MGIPILPGPPAPRDAEDAAIKPREWDWRKAVPMWFMQALCGCLIWYCGALYTRVDKLQDERLATLAAATKNAAALYISQIGERVATLEASERSQKDWNTDMARTMKGVTASNERLVAKVEVFMETQRRLTR